MLDDVAVEALASGIKTAFEAALPANLDSTIKASITATYTPMCAAIAGAIREFVLKASPEVEISSNDVWYATHEKMPVTQYLPVTVAGGAGQPGQGGQQQLTAKLTGDNISDLFLFTNDPGHIVKGRLK